ERNREDEEEPVTGVTPVPQEEEPRHEIAHHDRAGGEMNQVGERGTAGGHRVPQIMPYSSTQRPSRIGTVRNRMRSGPGTTSLSSTSIALPTAKPMTQGPVL